MLGGGETSATRTASAGRMRNRRWLAFLCVVIVASSAGGLYWWWAATRRHAPDTPTLAPIEEWSDPIVASPGYLGMEACAPCHAERVAEFKTTRHARACRSPTPGQMPEGFAPGRGVFTPRDPSLRFEMTERNGEFFQASVRATGAGDQRTETRIALAYGSGGVLDEVYFTWRGDRLYELPMVWLHPQNRFAIISHNPFGPGGDFARETTTRCLECHNTWIEHVPGTRNQYNRAGTILGVTCEKCHGPGREHALYHQAHPDASAGQAIVNPGGLSRERLLEVCTQCHGNAIRPRTRAFAYRPGKPLEDYFKTITTRHPDDDHVANQIQYLRQSKCFQKSDALTCITCHHPHRPHQEGRTGVAERACLKCHKSGDCAEQLRIPAAVRGECVACHMPARVWMNVHFHTEDDQYVPPIRRYQHRIAVDPVARDEVMLRWYGMQADETSKRQAAAIRKSLVDHWLGAAANQRRDFRFLAAIGAVREALRLDGSEKVRAELQQLVAIQAQLDAELVKGMHELEEQRFAAAADSLRKALAIKPDLALGHGKLGTATMGLGQKEAALKHLRAVSVHDPNEPYGEMMLGWLAYLDDRPDDAMKAYRRADEVEPFNAKTHYHWGLALVKAGNLPEAAAHFHQVLAIDPDHVGACHGLTRLLRTQGEPLEAIRYGLRAARLTRQQDAAVLLDLAESYADAGRHADAIRIASMAMAIVQERDPILAAQMRRQLQHWRSLAKN